MNKLIAMILTILIFASTVQADDAGVTGNAFLRIGMGARAAGMAGAFCAIADDSSSNYWNPAGLCGIKRQELLFMHTDWLSDIAGEYAAYAKPINENSSLGAGLIFLHAEDTARNYQAKETGNFNNHDACLSLSYASGRGNLAWGLTPKVIQRQLKDETAASVGLDIGSKYVRDNLSLGATIQNIGSRIKFISESSPSPLNLKLGIGYKMAAENDSLTIAGDINKPVDNDPSLSLGAEYNYANWAFARVGARIGSGSKQGLSAGLGVVLSDYRFDYAFTGFDDLGLTHRAAITRWFGGNVISHKDTEGTKKTSEKGHEAAIAISREETKGKGIVVSAEEIAQAATIPTAPAPVSVKETTPPEPEYPQQSFVFIFPDTRIFTPDGDGTLDSVTFTLRAVTQTQIIKWELRIVDRTDRTIQVFAGNGMPLETLIWDGRNQSGSITPSGSYFCTLSITDKNGRVWTSSKEVIVIE